MEIKKIGSQPSVKGPEEYFTGNVRIDSPFQQSGPGRAGGAIVTFEPGARTAWHIHPLGEFHLCDEINSPVRSYTDLIKLSEKENT